MTTTMAVNPRALTGSPSLGCTCAKNRDAGRPPSLFLHEYYPGQDLFNLRSDCAWDGAGIPSKCEYHATTRRHDTESCKGKTDER